MQNNGQNCSVCDFSDFEQATHGARGASQPQPTYPVVDVHAHIYPEKIALRAVASVGEFYHYPMAPVDGTSNGLIAASEGSPITHYIVHSVAVKPKTVASINDFIAQECAAHPQFIGFMAMHQDLEDPEAEIDRAIGLGLCGIKLHPDTQQVNMDDPRLMNIYEIAQAKHLPLIIHTGDYRYEYSRPERLKRILHTFPDLVVDAAHFGGWSIFDLGFEILEHERCFVDVSSAMTFLGPRRTYELIKLYGADRVLFGSDYPMWRPTSEYELFSAAPLSEEEREQILWHNAERFLGRSISH